ncbi:MAG: hypothetical protein LQ342_003442 [Letrouitia transgressa]|nr:MAG: hypothetical protein LQ342_003442 [Letrouitia transgressa]
MDHSENEPEAQQRSFENANFIPTQLSAIQLEQAKTNCTPDVNVAANDVKATLSNLDSSVVPVTEPHNPPTDLTLSITKCLRPTIFPPSPAKTPKRGIRPSRGTKPSLSFVLSHAFHIDPSPTPTLIGSPTPKRRIADELPSTPSKRPCPLPLSPRSPPRTLPPQPRPRQTTFRAQGFLGPGVAKVKRPKVSSFELKRVAEEILNQVDWKILAERVALNRRPWVYRKVTKGVLQVEVDRLVEKEDREDGRVYL